MFFKKVIFFLLVLLSSRCLGFFLPVEQLFSSFKRPFTVLDALQDNGVTAQQFMAHWPMCYVLIQQRPLSEQMPPIKELVVLKHAIDLETLKKLEPCEDFDVGLFDLTKYATEIDSEEFWVAIGNLSLFTVLIHIDDTMLSNFLEKHPGFLLQMHENDVAIIQRIDARILHHNSIDDQRIRNYLVYSTRESKWLYKPSFVNREWCFVQVPWKQGINLQTFLSLNGIIPSQSRIIELLYEKFHISMQDPMVRNVILMGDTLAFIDCKNDKWGRFDLSYRHRLFMFRGLLRAVDNTHKKLDFSRLNTDDYAFLLRYFRGHFPSNL